jgi:polar amino acid transport system substrate-binding protein
MNRRDFAAWGTMAGAASLAAVQPANAQGAPVQSTWDQIHQTGTLRVGVIAAQEPAFHKDPATGEWSGSMLSMARDIATTMGVKLQLLETT